MTRELDHRVSDRIDVRLLWREDDDTVFVAVADGKTGEQFAFDVRDRARVRHAFDHPFVYGPSAAWARQHSARSGSSRSSGPGGRRVR